ncbi:MAG: fluoride efflux transporter CrcB [Candidatus Omnitrophota bacterium]
MLKFLNVAIGGALGAILRYSVSAWSCRFFTGKFPWGTLMINLSGSLLIGFIWGICESRVVSHNLKLLIIIGLLGSFTTFSTFSLENFHLLRDGHYPIALLNIAVSFILGIALVVSGFQLSKILV